MLSGSVDGAGVIALFTTPAGIVVDTTGVIYLSDSNVIRRISVAGLIVLTWYYFWYRINSLFMFVIIYIGIVTRWAGGGTATGLGGGSIDGIGISALFSSPSSLVITNSGLLYVADTGNNLIRLISPTGV